MKEREQTKDENTEIVLQAVPVNMYRTDNKAYQWPSDRCTFCLVGKLRHVRKTSILVCRLCGGEYHIPHTA